MSRWDMIAYPLTAAMALCISCDVSVDPPRTDGGDDASIDADNDADIEGDPLRVITWNLENFPVSSNTTARVAEVIDELDVDLVGVQEIVSITDFADLVAALPEHDGIVANDPGADMVVGLLFRDARVRIIEEETLFTDDWYAFPRPPLKVQVEVLDSRGTVCMDAVVVVVHLKAQLDEESRQRRLAACERLDQWIEDTVGHDEVIIVGDWNDELTDDASWNVFQPFLDSPDRYRFLTKELAEAGAFTYLPFESFLDHILITTEALDELGNGSATVLELEATVPNYTYTISDHRPVLAEFELP